MYLKVVNTKSATSIKMAEILTKYCTVIGWSDRLQNTSPFLHIKHLPGVFLYL